MSIISKKFDNEISRIKQEFNTNKNIRHEGIKGGLNESELSSLIRDVIPKKYIITKGIIENHLGAQSNETDLLIYDDEILPAYLKNNLTFTPVEAVKYIFEIKSKLNANEIQTTIEKFNKFKSIGGKSPTVLFAFSTDIKGNELSRYRKYDKNLLTYPSISVLCVSNKCYYFKTTEEYYIKDFIDNKEFLALFIKSTNMISIEESRDIMLDIISNETYMSSLSMSGVFMLLKANIQIDNHINDMDEYELSINGVKYQQLKFKIHKWIGIEANDNNIELSLLSGISNTLSKGNFGHYLLHEKHINSKIISICYEDMWGHFSAEDFNENGLAYDVDKFNFSYESNGNDGSHRMIFKIID